MGTLGVLVKLVFVLEGLVGVVKVYVLVPLALLLLLLLEVAFAVVGINTFPEAEASFAAVTAITAVVLGGAMVLVSSLSSFPLDWVAAPSDLATTDDS